MQAHDDPELRARVRADSLGRPRPLLVCRGCKRELPRDRFERSIVHGKPASLRKYCIECRQGRVRIPINNGDGTYSIPLTKGQKALIDEIDLELVASHVWRAATGYSTFYAQSGSGKRGSPVIHMHRLILGMESDDPRDVDHINCDGLDNRRRNLRPVTRAENARRALRNKPNKTSRFRGVHWAASHGTWRASIHFDGELKRLGRFADEVEAAIAYDRAAQQFHGEFAVLNFPDGEVRDAA